MHWVVVNVGLRKRLNLLKHGIKILDLLVLVCFHSLFQVS